MKMMRTFLVALAALLSVSAYAQNVQQSGSVTPGHVATWANNGVIQDAGSAFSPRINALGIYGSGNTPLSIISTTSPGTATGQYVQLGFGVSNTAATISVTPFGGLSTVPLNININGTVIPIGGSNWLSAIIDSQIGSTQGQILYRGASVWSALNPGSSGQVLQTLGAAANPQWASAGGTGSVTSVGTGTGLTGGPVTSSGTISLSTPVAVANGGTGNTTLGAHGVLLGNGTSAVAVATPGASGTILQSNGASADPTWNSVAGTGTVTSVGTGTGLTGGTITTSGTVSFASVADGTVLANVTGGSAAPSATATPRLGITGTTLGTISLAGNTSGVVTIQPQAAAGTYNFNLPIVAGTAGQPMLSGGGGSSPHTYGTLGAAAGGTGLATLTANNVVLGNGTSAVQLVAPGSSGNVLTSNGTTWASSALTGTGFVLLSTQTASTSASIDFTSGITGTYSVYQIACNNLTASANADLYFRVSTDGGSNYASSAYYWANHGITSDDAAPAGTGAANTAQIILTQPFSSVTPMGRGGRSTAGLTMYMYLPSGAVLDKAFDYRGTYMDTQGGRVQTTTGSGIYDSATAVNAVRFIMASGTISGTCRLYGLSNT